MDFASRIITWYEKNKRDLPWRKTKDPYKIWLSEVILQQTRVDQQGIDGRQPQSHEGEAGVFSPEETGQSVYDGGGRGGGYAQMESQARLDIFPQSLA